MLQLRHRIRWLIPAMLLTAVAMTGSEGASTSLVDTQLVTADVASEPAGEPTEPNVLGDDGTYCEDLETGEIWPGECTRDETIGVAPGFAPSPPSSSNSGSLGTATATPDPLLAGQWVRTTIKITVTIDPLRTAQGNQTITPAPGGDRIVVDPAGVGTRVGVRTTGGGKSLGKAPPPRYDSGLNRVPSTKVPSTNRPVNTYPPERARTLEFINRNLIRNCTPPGWTVADPLANQAVLYSGRDEVPGPFDGFAVATYYGAGPFTVTISCEVLQ